MEKKHLVDDKSQKQSAELDKLLERFLASLEKKLQYIKHWPELKWDQVSI